jgi:hypothetical protein
MKGTPLLSKRAGFSLELGPTAVRQLGHLEVSRPVALRPRLAAGLPFKGEQEAILRLLAAVTRPRNYHNIFAAQRTRITQMS